MACLVSDRQNIRVRPEHIRDTCVLQTIKLIAHREPEILAQYAVPVVTEYLFALMILSRAEVCRKEIILTWIGEDIEVKHQLDDMIRKSDSGIISVLCVLTVESESL